MEDERWQRVQSLFEAALELPPAARRTFIRNACGDDLALNDEVTSLIQAHERERENETVPPSWLGVLDSADEPWFSAGEEVAHRYQIRQLLGKGGMGEVYEAWDAELSIPVALKALHFTTGVGWPVQQLKLEGLLARSVSHPNVCRVYDLGCHGDGRAAVWFLTMELLRGETLSERMQRSSPLAPDSARRFAEQMAAGLGAAHQAGVVHRDFKPANVMLVDSDGDEQAVVMDFGIARAATLRTGDPGEEPFMGTPAYMAPEQLLGEEVGPAADIYALGIVLHEMVTGRLPFADSAIETARQRFSVPEPTWSLIGVDPAWEAAIRRCLEREPKRRFERAEDLAKALAGEALHETTEVRATPPAPHNLPPERDTFVGRESEVAALARTLTGKVRLVTLLGTGGMGKTRLAVRYGWWSLEQWPGGVWFCDLTEARDLDGLSAAVGGPLRVPLGPGDPIEQLGRAIAGRGRCLLILDNVEQIVGHAAVAVKRWLERAPQSSFLVTSRERLGLIEWETIHNVESLPPSTALELFTARARWLRPGIELVGAEQDSAQEIVRLVDGMPLAIELAAARMRIMTATQIVQQMRSRFHLLTGGRDARHETLAGTIDGSWDLLSPWEQAAWAQCAVFEGGFTLAAAEGVLDLSAWPDAPWVVDVVQSLVDKSLLRSWVPVQAPGDGTPEARFGIYVSLQDYARLKLMTGSWGLPAAVEERHGRWFAQFGTEDAIDALDQQGGVARRRRIARDHDNITAACRRALARSDRQTAVATYRASCAVSELRGPFGGAVELGRQVLADPELAPADKAQVLRTLAQAERHAGESAESRRHFAAAITFYRQLGDRRREGILLGNLGGLLQAQGLVAEARECYQAALGVLGAPAERGYQGNVLSNLGTLCASQGRMDEARLHLETALETHRSLGNRRFEGVTLTTLGQLELDQGRLREALVCEEAALAIHREVGNRRFECTTLISLGNVRSETGDLDRAGELYEQAVTIAREIGNLRLEGEASDNLGWLAHRSGRLDEARPRIEQSIAIHRQSGNRRGEGGQLTRLAELLHDQGEHAAASELLTRAEEILRSVDDQIDLGQLLSVRSKIEHVLGRDEAAHRALAEAESIAERAGCGPDSALGRMIEDLRRVLSVHH